MKNVVVLLSCSKHVSQPNTTVAHKHNPSIHPSVCIAPQYVHHYIYTWTASLKVPRLFIYTPQVLNVLELDPPRIASYFFFSASTNKQSSSFSMPKLSFANEVLYYIISTISSSYILICCSRQTFCSVPYRSQASLTVLLGISLQSNTFLNPPK